MPGFRRKQSIGAIKSHANPEVRKRISKGTAEAHARGVYGSEWKKRLAEAQRKTNRADPEINRRRAESMKIAHIRGDFDHVYTEEARQKNSETSLAFWRRPGFYERQVAIYNSPETRIKHSIAKRGSKNPQWRDGSAVSPYGPEFDEVLKEMIRRRDHYSCAICGDLGKCVHHIDDDKTNNDPSNLITLCRSCHGKTIAGDRDYWRAYLISENHELALGAFNERN